MRAGHAAPYPFRAVNPLTSLLSSTLALLVSIGVVVLIVVRVGRRRRAGDESLRFDDFTPSEMDRLQSKGLLTADEAKRIQSVIARRAVDALEKPPAEEEEEDLQSLLAEAARLKRDRFGGEKPSPKVLE